MEIPSCRSCESTRLISVLDLGEQPWCNDLVEKEEDLENVRKYPLHLVSCLECSLLQLNYTVPKETMFLNHGYLSGMTNTLKAHFYRTAEENIQQFSLSSDDLIVDIGGNDGTQLLQYKELGCTNVVNVESAENIAKYSEKAGINTINNFFNEECATTFFKEDSVKLINAAGVFFHLEELHSVIRGIKKILAKDGVLVIQCMYAGSMVDNLSFDMIYHEHLCYYTLESLNNLLVPYGFKIFDAERSSIHSGSLIVKVGHATTPWERTPRFFETQEEDKKYNLSAFLRMGDVVRKHKDDLLAYLEEIRNTGARIFAYGAPAKGNTLLNYMGVDCSLIEKAVEINKLKIGHYLPQSGIPIVDEAEVTPPDYYLLLSHNFADEILKKNKSLRDEGLQFIIPFPQMELAS
jgi:SAM-dependent methyltransferase